jgi:predicted nucleic acid-binding protein
MDRIFLDANILFSAAYRVDSGLLVLWKFADVVLHSSRYAVEEARLNLEEDGQRKRLEDLCRRLKLFDTESRDLPRGITLPEKDVPILLSAVNAEADYLLTGDIRHFGAFFGKKIDGIIIFLPGQYLRSRGKR